MPDVSSLSDAALMDAIGRGGGVPATPNIQSMSDADLMKAINIQKADALGQQGFAGQVLHGMPVIGNLFDKAAAGVDTLFGNGGYEENLAKRRGETAQYQQQHPAASVAGQLIGGGMALGPLAEAAPAAMGVDAGSGLIANSIRSGLSGAGIGAANAVAGDENPVSGAISGAGYGLAGPAIGKIGGKILGAVTRPFQASPNTAADILGEQLSAQGLRTPQEVEAHLKSIGPEAKLADVNPVTQQLGGVLAASPGEAQQIMRQSMVAREKGAGARVASDIDSVLGKPVDLNQKADQIYQDAKAKAGPLYQAGYNTPIQSNPALDDVLNTPYGKQAIARAAKLTKSDTNAPPSIMFKPPQTIPQLNVPPEKAAIVQKLQAQGIPDQQIAEFAGVPMTNGPAAPQVDVGGLHYVRQAYDDMINNAKGSNNLRRILQSNRAIVDQTLKQVPGFADADKIYSDMSGIRNSMDEGLKVFSNNQTPQDIAAAFSDKPQAQQQAYLEGARGAIRNVMGTARNDANAARGLFAKEFNQEKLRYLIGDGADTVLNRIGAENVYKQTGDRILGNSETAARVLGKEALKGAHGLPPNLMEYSGWEGLLRGIVLKPLRATMEAVATGKQKAIETQLAKLLTAAGPDRASAIQMVMDAAQRKDPSGALGRVISQIALAQGSRPPKENRP